MSPILLRLRVGHDDVACVLNQVLTRQPMLHLVILGPFITHVQHLVAARAHLDAQSIISAGDTTSASALQMTGASLDI